MPTCLLDNRIIDRALRREGLQGRIPDGYGNRDHIVPLEIPESPGDVWSNVRAAHTLCNGQAAANPSGPQTIPDQFRSNLREYLLAVPEERPTVVVGLSEGDPSLAGLLHDLEADDTLRTRLEEAVSKYAALW
jgi:hypothetical protein